MSCALNKGTHLASFRFHGTDAVDVTLVTRISLPIGSPHISTRSHGFKQKPEL
jgi:hypothetical protein